MKAFKAPKKYLAHLDADTMASIVAAVADVALILDKTGVIRDVAFNNDDLRTELDGTERWVGRAWGETVTPDSRNKTDMLLREAEAGAAPHWRHVNYRSPRGGPPTPVLFSAVRVDDGGRCIAFGRDLRSVSALQQQLVDAQQSMERDYSRLRHIETRYRLLFQMSSEPVLIVDVANQKIVECNPAASHLLGEVGARLIGRAFIDAFDHEGARTVTGLLAGVKTAGRAESTQVQLGASKVEVTVTASLFRQGDATLFFIRLTPVDAAATADTGTTAVPILVKLVENAPDGIVVTEPDGHVITANEAFLEMAQLTSPEQLRSESIERWLGRSGVDLSVLIANLLQRGSVRLFATTLRGEHGSQSDVEISAVSLMSGDKRCLGFLIRNVGRRLKTDLQTVPNIPQSADQLAELVGRVSLKQLVRDATDLIEKLAIESALRLTDDNRASAAEILGLSRQSLYVKLRRYGLADASVQAGSQEGAHE